MKMNLSLYFALQYFALFDTEVGTEVCFRHIPSLRCFTNNFTEIIKNTLLLLRYAFKDTH